MPVSQNQSYLLMDGYLKPTEQIIGDGFTFNVKGMETHGWTFTKQNHPEHSGKKYFFYNNLGCIRIEDVIRGPYETKAITGFHSTEHFQLNVQSPTVIKEKIFTIESEEDFEKWQAAAMRYQQSKNIVVIDRKILPVENILKFQVG